MKQIQIIGNLGKDAEVKKISENDYAVFSVAVTEKDITTWFDCLKYGTNEKLLPYLVKGTKVFIQGNLGAKISESNGKTYLNLSVNVDKLQLIGSKSDSQQQTQQATNAQPEDYAPQAATTDDSGLPF